MAEDIEESYRSSLQDLTFNSKPLINMLTMLAEDHETNAPQIVQVIEQHVEQVKTSHKLPVMYLIDSIVKNLPRSLYPKLLSQNIAQVFCNIFEEVDEKTRTSLFKLRQTWKDIFPNNKLYAIDVRVNRIDPAWPITAKAPEQGNIYVNPKFLVQNPEKARFSPPAPSPPPVDDPEELMRQQLQAKEQELQKLKLELELAETRAKLEQQRKQLEEQHRKEQLDQMKFSTSVSGPQPQSIPDAKVSNSGARDPRLTSKDPRKGSRDPRLAQSNAPVAPFGNLAVLQNTNVVAALSNVLMGSQSTDSQESSDGMKSVKQETKKASPPKERKDSSSKSSSVKKISDKKDSSLTKSPKKESKTSKEKQTESKVVKKTSKSDLRSSSKDRDSKDSRQSRSISPRDWKERKGSKERETKSKSRDKVEKRSSDDEYAKFIRQSYRRDDDEHDRFGRSKRLVDRSIRQGKNIDKDRERYEPARGRRGSKEEYDRSPRRSRSPQKREKDRNQYNTKPAKPVEAKREIDPQMRTLPDLPLPTTMPLDQILPKDFDVVPPKLNTLSVKREAPELDVDERPYSSNGSRKGGPPDAKRARTIESEMMLENAYMDADTDYRLGGVNTQLKSPLHDGWTKFKSIRNEHYGEEMERRKSRDEAIMKDIDLRRLPSPSVKMKPPPLPPAILTSNMSIPTELQLDKQKEVLLEAQKHLDAGTISHQQHQEILKQLGQVYEIQRHRQNQPARTDPRLAAREARERDAQSNLSQMPLGTGEDVDHRRLSSDSADSVPVDVDRRQAGLIALDIRKQQQAKQQQPQSDTDIRKQLLADLDVKKKNLATVDSVQPLSSDVDIRRQSPMDVDIRKKSQGRDPRNRQPANSNVSRIDVAVPEVLKNVEEPADVDIRQQIVADVDARTNLNNDFVKKINAKEEQGPISSDIDHRQQIPEGVVKQEPQDVDVRQKLPILEIQSESVLYQDSDVQQMKKEDDRLNVPVSEKVLLGDVDHRHTNVPLNVKPTDTVNQQVITDEKNKDINQKNIQVNQEQEKSDKSGEKNKNTNVDVGRESKDKLAPELVVEPKIQKDDVDARPQQPPKDNISDTPVDMDMRSPIKSVVIDQGTDSIKAVSDQRTMRESTSKPLQEDSDLRLCSPPFDDFGDEDLRQRGPPFLGQPQDLDRGARRGIHFDGGRLPPKEFGDRGRPKNVFDPKGPPREHTEDFGPVEGIDRHGSTRNLDHHGRHLNFDLHGDSDHRGPPLDFERVDLRGEYDRHGSKENFNRRGPPENFDRRGSRENFNRRGPPENFDHVDPELERRDGHKNFERRIHQPEILDHRGPPRDLDRSTLGEFDRRNSPVEFDRHGPPGEFDRHGPHGDFSRRGHPENFDRPGPPGDFDRPGPPGDFDRPGPPGDLDRSGPPRDFVRHGPPREFENSPPREFRGIHQEYNRRGQPRLPERSDRFDLRSSPPRENERDRHRRGKGFRESRPDGRRPRQKDDPFEERRRGPKHPQDNAFGRHHRREHIDNRKLDVPRDSHYPNELERRDGGPRQTYHSGDTYGDPRWNAMKGFQQLEDREEFVIDGRPFEISVGQKPRKIPMKGTVNEIYADPVQRAIVINGLVYYKFGEPIKEIEVKQKTFSVYFHGLPKTVWIDGTQYELRIDAPPRNIVIDGKTKGFQIDGRDMMILVDRIEKGTYGGPPRQLPIDGVLHEIRFDAPPRQILIDGESCDLILDRAIPVVICNGKPHGIRFDGDPRAMIIDDFKFIVPMDEAVKVRIRHKPHILAFGGPAHEVVINGKRYEIKFDGVTREIVIGHNKHTICLEGPTPNVKILDEVPVEYENLMLKELRVQKHLQIPKHSPQMQGKVPVVPQNFGPRPIIPQGPRPMAQQGPRPMMQQGPLPVMQDGPRPMMQEGPRPMMPGGPGMIIDNPRPMLQEGPQPVMPGGHAPMMQGQQMMQGTQMTQPVMGQQGLNMQGGMMMQQGNMVMPNQMMSGMQSMMSGMQMPQGQMMMGGMGMMQQGFMQPNVPVSQGVGLPNVLSSLLPGGGAMQPSMPQAASLDVGSLFHKLVAAGIIPKSEKTEEKPKDEEPKEKEKKDTFEKGDRSKRKWDHRDRNRRDQHDKWNKNHDPPSQKSELPPKEKVEEVPVLEFGKMDPFKKYYHGVVQTVYSGIQCSSCGSRFRVEDTEVYREHLDWHFRQNKRDKGDMKVARNRNWYYKLNDWIQFEEFADVNEKGHSVFFEKLMESQGGQTEVSGPTINIPPGVSFVKCPPATSNEQDDMCCICHDPFEQYWNEEAEDWHLRDAIRVDNKTYHPVCYEDAREEGSILEPSPTPTTSSSVNPLESQLQQSVKSVIADNSSHAMPVTNPVTTSSEVLIKSDPVDVKSPLDHMSQQIKKEPNSDPDSTAQAPDSASLEEPSSTATSLEVTVSTPTEIKKEL